MRSTAPIARKKKRKGSFDAKTCLTRIGEGRTISKYRENQIIFAQRDPADAVF